MKRMFKFLSLLFTAILLLSCAQSTESDNGDVTITAGWYKHTWYSKETGKRQLKIVYFYIKADGSIERAGDEDEEYTGRKFNDYKSLNYSFCKGLAEASSEYTFAPCDAPIWANEDKVTAGWYAYTTNADDIERQQITYLYINVDGSIEKAGSTSNEYTGNQLENFAQLSYSICKKNAKLQPDEITFIPCEAPTWGASEDENFEEVNTGSTSDESSGSTSEEGTSSTLNEGCELWVFKKALIGSKDLYCYYVNGELSRAGTKNEENSPDDYVLFKNLEQSKQNYRGTKYQITNDSEFPSWF